MDGGLLGARLQSATFHASLWSGEYDTVQKVNTSTAVLMQRSDTVNSKPLVLM